MHQQLCLLRAGVGQLRRHSTVVCRDRAWMCGLLREDHMSADALPHDKNTHRLLCCLSSARPMPNNGMCLDCSAALLDPRLLYPLESNDAQVG